MEITRRALLGSSLGAITVAALAACTGPVQSSVSSTSGSAAELTWWDLNVNLQKANAVEYAAFKKKTGASVKYTYIDASKLGQSLQLARQSKELPDIHGVGGLNQTTAALVAAGWFSPIEWDKKTQASFGKDALVEGIHVFGGKVYTFPIFADRQYDPATWFNHELIKKSGLDPDDPPTGYDEFRAACRQIQKKNSGVYGVILNLGMSDRMSDQVNALAQAAGFQGIGGREFKTGEFAYESDAYLEVFEFLLALKTDGLLFPGSTSLTDATARVRWAAGGAGYFLDGPWCAGTVQTSIKDFLPQVDCGPILRPKTSSNVALYNLRAAGNYYISSESKHVDEASQLLALLASKQYGIGIANAMAQPPHNLSAVSSSTAVKPWKRLVKEFEKTVYLAPDPLQKNINTREVAARLKGVTLLGDVLAGAFSGAVTDVKGALAKLSDDTSADYAQALTAAKSAGIDVSESDYAFGDWKPGADYTGYHHG